MDIYDRRNAGPICADKHNLEELISQCSIALEYLELNPNIYYLAIKQARSELDGMLAALCKLTPSTVWALDSTPSRAIAELLCRWGSWDSYIFMDGLYQAVFSCGMEED